MEATVNELQTQLTAVQATLEGNLQSSLFQLHSFNGLPNKDINEWQDLVHKRSNFSSDTTFMLENKAQKSLFPCTLKILL